MAASDMHGESDESLAFDVYRTIVLGRYMQHWGMPEYRRVIRKSADQSFFEMYTFPSTDPMQPFRIASVGLATQIKPDGEREGKEYFMVLPDDMGGAERDEVFNYVADIAVHLVNNVRRSCHLPRLLGPSPLAPASWGAKALLIAEATGESEEFNIVSIGDGFEMEIEWLIPLREAEYKFILEKGMDPFDDLVQESEQSLADVNREGLVS
ncbi:suppressor of fused domain protein [Massilia sp. DJPM01]|uniref:suppressor of fused domain protein n=1 Tax=Massilia sp. DJPM01 TaxID=3024404 RepID=UPI00259DA699|nr:suppressor of fused domain protein [Massilia sp. DJPM01]MDM5179250.1 suppressor of fused domain protein [Massilia sp. DJPM01]